MTQKPLISIVTVNLNDLKGLQKTFKSVFDQTWQEFEYIIIDGGSTDGSKELIEENRDRIDHRVSERDSGIYNAMNKGVKMASGEYLVFLNSGDSLFNENVLARVAEELKRGFDIFYGNVYLIGTEKERELLAFPDKLSFSFFCNSTITHQAAFIKNSLFEDLFYYNEEYQLVSDWEFLIYAICKANCSYQHLDMPVCNYDINGLTSQEENIQLMSKERKEVLEKHFPLFTKDYEELFKARQKIGSPRIKAFSYLEQNRLAKRINSIMFKIFAR